MDNARKWKIAIAAAFFLFIAFYAFYRSTDLIFGVKIRDVTFGGLPAQASATVSESVIEASGNARNALHLYLNGREISIDLEGNFKETLALLPGYNIVTMRAVDKFGYEDEKDYQLIYKVEGS